MATLLECDDVEHSYGSVRAIDKVSLSVAAGEFVCLLGPSGCGKTTLLNMVAGFVTPTTGSIRVDGRVVDRPAADRLVVFQDYGLFPWQTVEANVNFGLRLAGFPRAERRARRAECINLVGLRGFERHYPAQLSGGMKQRVGLARCLALEPRLLLMDEPLAALDAYTRSQMQREILRIWEQRRTTVLFVTHSVEEALVLADRVIVFSARPGRVEANIPVTLARPRDPTGADFNALRRRVDGLAGEVFGVAAYAGYSDRPV